MEPSNFSKSQEQFRMNDPELFKYEKNKSDYVDRVSQVTSDFAQYFDLNIKNQSEIRALAEKSLEFNFAIVRVSVDCQN